MGAQGTVCGGGRYDRLVESVGGKPTPCVGFGLGLERLIMLMEALNLPFGNDNGIDVFVMNQNADFVKQCLSMVRTLRSSGISAETDYTGRSLKAQFKYADKIGARHAVVIGESEVSSDRYSVKRFSDGKIFEMKKDEIVGFLQGCR